MNATTQNGHTSNVYVNVMCTFELYMFNVVVTRGQREEQKCMKKTEENNNNNDDDDDDKEMELKLKQ